MAVTGLDEIRRNIDKLKRNLETVAEETNGKQVPLSEMLTDDFMQANSEFQTLDEMTKSFGLKAVEDIKTQEWSDFVAAHSQFDSWDAMYQTAGKQYLVKKIKPAFKL